MTITMRRFTRMTTRRFAPGLMTVVASVILASAALTLPASAQFLEGPLSAREVGDALQDYGYRIVGQPRRSGDTYVVDGIGSGGRRARLVVDAYDGTLIGARALALSAPDTRDRSSSSSPSAFGVPLGNEPRLTPPRDVPEGRKPAVVHKPQPQKQQAAARRDGGELRAGPEVVPEQRKPAEGPAAEERASGTGAIPKKVEKPAEPLRNSGPVKKSLEKPVEKSAGITGNVAAQEQMNGQKNSAQSGVVPPVVLDDVKPRRLGEPPPMPAVAPLE